MQHRKFLSLKEWINETGISEIAKLLRTQPAAIRHWRRGHCLPKSSQMYQIKRVSRGRVTYDEIIDTYFKVPRGGKK